MIEVYFYIPVEEAENAVACGLKLSQWFCKETVIESDMKPCMTALLNPKDDIKKYKDEGYLCLKLQLESRYCYVADQYLYEIGENVSEAMALYNQSVIPIEKYIFGSYRSPECLVTSTVIAGYISVLNKKLDSPVLFDNSEDLYINNVVQEFKETYVDFYDTLLYSFFSRLEEAGAIIKFEDKVKGRAVFLDTRDGKTVALRIPEMEKY